MYRERILAMATLSPAIREFLAPPRFAVVATIAADGVPHQTVVWYDVDGDDIIFSVPQDTVKHRNLARDPRMSMCIEEGFRYVSLQGTVALEEDQNIVMAAYKRMGERYAGAMPSRPTGMPTGRAASYLARGRVSVRLTIERVINMGIE
jgi:PPOX class probable F420-dependent enzyme